MKQLPCQEKLSLRGFWSRRSVGIADEEAVVSEARWLQESGIGRVPPRRFKAVGLAVPLALWLMLALPASPGDILVTGDCTLTDAIIAANTDAVSGSCPAGAGRDRLTLSADWLLTAPYSGEDGLPEVTSKIEILGEGHKIERVGSAPFRILRVSSEGTLTLENTRIRKGRVENPPVFGGGIYNLGSLTLTNSTVSGNVASSYWGDASRGGGIYSAGTLALRNSTVAGNEVGRNGGPSVGPDATGGGIFSSGTAMLVNSTVAGNGARWGGTFGYNKGVAGGIYNGGTMSLLDSTVSGNVAAGGTLGPGEGGGILNRGALSVYGSALTGNVVTLESLYTYAAHGGGMLNFGTAVVDNSTVSGNRAEATKGFFTAQAFGGGIDNHGQLVVSNSTFSGNSATAELYWGGTGTADGGGIINHGGTSSLSNSIVTDSTPNDCAGLIVDDGGNRGCGSTAVTNFDTTLADHGGPTQTHQLWPGSNAIDIAGSCALFSDQRGAVRPGGACDTGAFEELGCALLELANRTVDTSEDHDTCSTALLGPDLIIEGAGVSLTVQAGALLRFNDGFEVGSGSEVHVGTDALLLP